MCRKRTPMSKDNNNTESGSWLGCLGFLLIIAFFIVTLFTDIPRNLFGNQIAAIIKYIVILIVAYLTGTYVFGTGPRWKKRPSPATGFVCVGIIVLLTVAAIVLGHFYPSLFEKAPKVEVVPVGRYAEDDSLKEKKVYYVLDGECYHKKSKCPTLHDSDVIYKCYIGDVPADRRPCGVCYY